MKGFRKADGFQSLDKCLARCNGSPPAIHCLACVLCKRRMPCNILGK